MRPATEGDASSAADLIVRTKRLNNEFDPMFAVVEGARARAERYVVASLDADDRLLLVASEGPKVVGVLRAEMRERMFYEPSPEGFITDFYILPEHRRRALGHDMLERATRDLKKMGARVIVAEVPTQNEIGYKFYTKRGFRSLVQHFGKQP
ncbi:MAG: GNAT family N-acetyltransferase [Thaumarchaeota archaeon]|nr:GNAT family N-acetyltransferase [Nitrososphaerota archaeon]